MLTIDNLSISIGGSPILREVSLELPAHRVFCLMGRNGVGKTTMLKNVMGLYKPSGGRVLFEGQDISRMPVEARARAGIGYVPQGRRIFPHLTVEENLFIGAIAQGKKPKQALERVCSIFPIIQEFLPRKGGILFGGQQQQLAIGRALLTEPKLLILDEPTERIQPNIIDQIGEAIQLLRPPASVRNTRSITKRDLVWNGSLPKIKVDPETYTVKADGVVLRCEPASVLPMAQRYFLF